MKTLTLLFALSATTLADLRSASFRLMLSTPTNSTINGTVLGACHKGAAIEGLCPYGSITDAYADYTTFYQNISDSSASFTDADGILGYDSYYGTNGTDMVPSSMRLETNPGSNTAVPIFFPSNDSTSYVAFDECGSMYIRANTDDRVSPPATGEFKMKNWWLCTTYWAYTYTTLAWAVGFDAVPQNPTCVKVDVKRVFIGGVGV